MSEKPSLIRKLAEVMAAVDRVPKRGRNTFHGYDYATEADIADAIRSELAKRQVVLLPSVVGMGREPVGEKGQVLTTITMEFTFFDGETGEYQTRKWAGAGTDKEDKGLYKAMTGGEKYFLLKTFLLATGDDPEHADGATAQQAEPAQKAAHAPAQAPAKATRPEPTTRTHANLYVLDVKAEQKAKKAGGTFTKYQVTFSDGTVAGTAKRDLADEAAYAKAHKAPVLIETKPFGTKDLDLVSLVPITPEAEPEGPPLDSYGPETEPIPF